jgi:hypothetical protein
MGFLHPYTRENGPDGINKTTEIVRQLSDEVKARSERLS